MEVDTELFDIFQFWLNFDNNKRHFIRQYTCISAHIPSLTDKYNHITGFGEKPKRKIHHTLL